jgi:hypothetical protein
MSSDDRPAIAGSLRGFSRNLVLNAKNSAAEAPLQRIDLGLGACGRARPHVRIDTRRDRDVLELVLAGTRGRTPEIDVVLDVCGNADDVGKIPQPGFEIDDDVAWIIRGRERDAKRPGDLRGRTVLRERLVDRERSDAVEQRVADRHHFDHHALPTADVLFYSNE